MSWRHNETVGYGHVLGSAKSISFGTYQYQLQYSGSADTKQVPMNKPSFTAGKLEKRVQKARFPP